MSTNGMTFVIMFSGTWDRTDI